MHYIAYDPALFINGKRSEAESYTEDRKYLCRFHSCNEILKRLYGIFETSKKQDLTPPWSDPTMVIETSKKQDPDPTMVGFRSLAKAVWYLSLSFKVASPIPKYPYASNDYFLTTENEMLIFASFNIPIWHYK